MTLLIQTNTTSQKGKEHSDMRQLQTWMVPEVKQKNKQGMIDGSASKPALRQDTGYMVEKTYLDIAPYLGLLGPI